MGEQHISDAERRAGEEYLREHRAWWSYLPILWRSWNNGFAVGYAAAVIYREKRTRVDPARQVIIGALALIESQDYYEAKSHKAWRDLEAVRRALETYITASEVQAPLVAPDEQMSDYDLRLAGQHRKLSGTLAQYVRRGWYAWPKDYLDDAQREALLDLVRQHAKHAEVDWGWERDGAGGLSFVWWGASPTPRYFS